jgi:hypothetical protein
VFAYAVYGALRCVQAMVPSMVRMPFGLRPFVICVIRFAMQSHVCIFTTNRC